ncbi:cytochrome P450 [Infundibulicybe gibba]|nr:cytochrome P450 [Infundibulicybe gibba]
MDLYPRFVPRHVYRLARAHVQSPPLPAIQVTSPVESDSESEVQVQGSYTEVADAVTIEKGTASKDTNSRVHLVAFATHPPRLPPYLLIGSHCPQAHSAIAFYLETHTFIPSPTGFTTVIVIGRVQAAIDIMEKEGAALVDRPLCISADETRSGGIQVLLTPAGDRFKKTRKALHTHLQPRIVADATPPLTAASPVWVSLCVRVCGESTSGYSFGKRYLLNLIQSNAMHRYIPGYLKELQQGRKEELDLFKTHLEEDSPTPPPPSFSTYLLSQQKSLALFDSETAYLTGSMFGAGSDTTASAISISVLVAALYPETYARVRVELLATCPTPPRLTDKPSLPHTTTFVLETFRWRPVSAGGFVHRATKDIIWINTLIPAGATVIRNVWAIGRDPAVFKDPETFNPSGGLMRMGMYVGVSRVAHGHDFGVLNTALLFWAFEISADPTAPIDPLAFTESANTHPLPFKVNFVPCDGVREAMEEYE